MLHILGQTNRAVSEMICAFAVHLSGHLIGAPPSGIGNLSLVHRADCDILASERCLSEKYLREMFSMSLDTSLAHFTLPERVSLVKLFCGGSDDLVVQIIGCILWRASSILDMDLGFGSTKRYPFSRRQLAGVEADADFGSALRGIVLVWLTPQGLKGLQ